MGEKALIREHLLGVGDKNLRRALKDKWELIKGSHKKLCTCYIQMNIHSTNIYFQVQTLSHLLSVP